MTCSERLEKIAAFTRSMVGRTPLRGACRGIPPADPAMTLMARPALSVFIGEFDPTRKVHLLLGSVNMFYLWSTGVLALALSRLSNAPLGKAAVWMFGFWAVSRVFFVVIGFGGFVL